MLSGSKSTNPFISQPNRPMAKIHVSPAQQRKFANFLEDRSKHLVQKKTRFVEMLGEAAAICKDQRYATFQMKTVETARNIDDFRKTCVKYVDYLRRKSAAGDRYLKGG